MNTRDLADICANSADLYEAYSRVLRKASWHISFEQVLYMLDIVKKVMEEKK